jgi:phosphatidylethanolamine/phosphatidyl-N-methylethanolamine N-methyltransferase
MKRVVGHVADTARFLRHFITDPQKTGAILPSSRALARLMADGMGLEKARVVVDVGAGTGVFTAEALRRAPPGAKVIAIEINPHFARVLKRRYPRVRVISDSVEHLPRDLRKAGHRHADAIMCSLPWSHFPVALQRRLLSAMVVSLRPGGRLSSFAYIHSSWWPSARRFRRLLESRFRKVTRTRVAWLNTPPAFVYRCVK